MPVLMSQVDCGAANHRPSAGRFGRYFGIAVICVACINQFTNEAWAQCTARDVLQGQLKVNKIRSVDAPRRPVRSARDVPAWKTITVGTFADSIALRNALDAVGCSAGGLAEEILARPDFIVSSDKQSVDLVAVRVAELGFTTDTVTLAVIYARARQLGFELAAAEVGPQLRLQYFDQPIGEFLVVGMKPIRTWSGDPVVLNVANGGAARSNEPAPGDGLETTAALPPP